MAADADAATTPAEDAELMRRVQVGDEAALAQLMQRWERPVKSVIARLVLNTREADDLAQETFVRLWQQRAKFNLARAFRPWIFSIAINLARNRLRWWRSRPEVALEAWNETPETASSGLAALEQIECATAVRDAVGSLSANLREAIILSEYEGMSHAEIAATVGATAKAVENRVARAREKLRGMLSRAGAGRLV